MAIKHKIAILTLPFEPNYGWILQLWALYSFLREQGHDVIVIDRRWNDDHSSFVKNILRFIYYHFLCRAFTRFLYGQMNVSPSIRHSSALRDYIIKEEIDTIVVGSDQVWRIENTRGADLNFFLDFAEGLDVRRMAYAASFGDNLWKGTVKETQRVSELLKGFCLVSVREKEGVRICHEEFGIEATQVVDPTLLLSSEKYAVLYPKTEECHQCMIATYFLDNNEWKQSLVADAQRKYHARAIPLCPAKPSRYTIYKKISTWLRILSGAQYVMVDSFHGMVFALIMKKQFLVVANIRRGNSRFTSLLSSIGLSQRLISENDDIDSVLKLLDTPIDYHEVDLRLSEQRRASAQVLLSHLG
jgi:hypothetical protein